MPIFKRYILFLCIIPISTQVYASQPDDAWMKTSHGLDRETREIVAQTTAQLTNALQHTQLTTCHGLDRETRDMLTHTTNHFAAALTNAQIATSHGIDQETRQAITQTATQLAHSVQNAKVQLEIPRESIMRLTGASMVLMATADMLYTNDLNALNATALGAGLTGLFGAPTLAKLSSGHVRYAAQAVWQSLPCRHNKRDS